MFNWLTPKQLALLPVYRDRLIKIGLCTDPADRLEAERGVQETYWAAGLKPPDHIEWCDSPMEAWEKIGDPPEWAAMVARVRLIEQLTTTRWGQIGVELEIKRQIIEPIVAQLRAQTKQQGEEQPSQRAKEILYQQIKKLDQEFTLVAHQLDMSVVERVAEQVLQQLDIDESRELGENVSSRRSTSIIRRVDRRVPFDIDESRELEENRNPFWRSKLERASLQAGYGQFTVPKLALDVYLSEVFDFPEETKSLTGLRTKSLTGLWRIAKSANWWFPHENACYICERPRVIAFDGQERLHREDGPAIEYRDGWGVYVWHGVRVPDSVILRPDTIDVQQIENEMNVEVRRIMIERYGAERFLIDSGAEEIQRDRHGILYRKAFLNDEPLVMVKVTDPSTGRKYFLRVPPNTRTAQEGVAWTFGMNAEDYHPKFES
jgi:hypothetical protein